MGNNKRGPEMRRDAVNSRWTIFSPARSLRPSDFKSKPKPNSVVNQPSQNCPFCLGREHECAPEIFRVPPLDDDNNNNNNKWTLRVIQNLYPALSRDVEVVEPSCGVEDKCKEAPAEMCDLGVERGPKASSGDVAIRGFGYHDVVIETPLHSVQLWELGKEGVGDVVMAYKKRILQLSSQDAVKYIQVFKNHGASAGASMSHSHSQIMALPVIPPTVSTRLASMKEHFDQTRKCSLCEIKTDLFIEQSAHFISIVPFAAAFPFELWIVPLDHSSHFHDIDRDKADDLGGLLKLMLKKIALQLNDPPFNFMIQSSPLHITPSQLPYSHWFLQIVPQLSGVGGFEIGTGCYINPVFPEDATKVLRDVSVSD